MKRRAFLIILGSLNYKLEKGRIMAISEQVQKDMVEAMRGRDELRLSTLRMVKAALENKKIEKRSPLDEKESQQVLSTLIKQRRDSIEQFQKGGRQELADKEAAEIKIIEAYLPKAMGEEDITAAVKATIAEMPNLVAIVLLGRVAHDSTAVALSRPLAALPFSHGAQHAVGRLTLFDSYHCSRYNTNTGVLTPDMFREVFAAARHHLDKRRTAER